MTRRARLLAVVALLATGALGVISSTQTWILVMLDDGASESLAVPGAAAIPVLAPLSLAVLALGAALSIVGLVLRYVFGALTVAIAVVLNILTWDAWSPDVHHVAATVTEATGITGEVAVGQLIASTATTPWPVVTNAAWVVLLAAGVFTLVTARVWRGSGRRYRTDASPVAATGPATSRPHDAIDDWDDLSRGEDPTTRPLD